MEAGLSEIEYVDMGDDKPDQIKPVKMKFRRRRADTRNVYENLDNGSK